MKQLIDRFKKRIADPTCLIVDHYRYLIKLLEKEKE